MLDVLKMENLFFFVVLTWMLPQALAIGCDPGYYFSEIQNKCVPCPPGQYQDEYLYKKPSCNRCRQRSYSVWKEVKKCTSTTDTVWECVEGYVLQGDNCVREDVKTTKQDSTQRSTTLVTSTEAINSSTAMSPHNNDNDDSMRNALIGVIIGITVVVLIVVLFKRYSKKGKVRRKKEEEKLIADKIDTEKDKQSENKSEAESKNESESDTKENSKTSENVPEKGATNEQSLDANECQSCPLKPLTEKESLSGVGVPNGAGLPNNETKDISEDEQLETVLYSLCQRLVSCGKKITTTFFYILEDRSGIFHASEFFPMKQNEDKHFTGYCEKALMCWVKLNKEHDHGALITKALKLINRPTFWEEAQKESDLASTLHNNTYIHLKTEESQKKGSRVTGSKDEVRELCEPEFLLYRLFFTLTRLLPPDALTKLLLQLENSDDKFIINTEIEQQKYRYSNDVDLLFVETFMEWRRRNRQLNLRSVLKKTLLDLSKKEVCENEEYCEILEELEKVSESFNNSRLDAKNGEPNATQSASGIQDQPSLSHTVDIGDWESGHDKLGELKIDIDGIGNSAQHSLQQGTGQTSISSITVDGKQQSFEGEIPDHIGENQLISFENETSDQTAVKQNFTSEDETDHQTGVKQIFSEDETDHQTGVKQLFSEDKTDHLTGVKKPSFLEDNSFELTDVKQPLTG